MQNPDRFLEELQVHLLLSFAALILGTIICIPLGIWCAKQPSIASTVMNTVNSIRVIPSLAILVIMLPIIGTGFLPAFIALTILACPPILINTFLGFRNIDDAVMESARGMGMSEKVILRKIEFPLAMPLMIAGIKTASVEVLASASLAAFIGGGVAGTFSNNGLSMFSILVWLGRARAVAV